MKYEQLALSIIEKVGGEENISSVVHCITRLRFRLKDESKALTEELKNEEGILTVIQTSGQYQVVVGSHVADVHKALLKVGHMSTEVVDDPSEEKTGNAFTQFVDLVFGMFHPVLGVLLASGLFKGLTAVFRSLGWLDATSGTYFILNATGQALFHFLPIFLGYSVTKKFGGTPFIGMTLGAILMYPSIVGVPVEEPLYTLFEGTVIESPIYMTFLGIPVILMNYASSLIPIVLVSYMGAKVERKLQKVLPSDVKTLAVPFTTLLVTVPLAFLVIGPITTWGGALLTTLIANIHDLSPILAGLLFGGLWQVFVMFGLHWVLIPLCIHNILTFGYDVTIVAMLGGSFAQMGAVLAVRMKTQNPKLKEQSLPAVVSGLFGVLEPAIYGITLPLKRPFIASCLASAVAGGIMGYFGAKIYLICGLGIFGLPNYIHPELGMDRSFWGAVIASVVAVVLGFILTYVLGFEEVEDQNVEITLENVASYAKKLKTLK